MTIEQLKKIYKSINAKWDEVNIFGIRNPDSPELDQFNDMIGIATEENVKIFRGTTDPGIYWTINPITAAGLTGAAHVCEGFHPYIWRVGIHAQGTNFAHQALVQTGNKIKIWRDINKDFRPEDEPTQVGYFGINLHRASSNTDAETIGRYSAGCQVIQHADDFTELLNLVKASDTYQKHGASARFSYLLINKNDLANNET
jgi:hypothetical protein